mmetsp:Transcript_40985/g.112711  ORF Transcript_40985/g.112711 Transcript_40985/m.112711 type:complete len:228 (+) Transcript_40985:868-1551(+)
MSTASFGDDAVTVVSAFADNHPFVSFRRRWSALTVLGAAPTSGAESQFSTSLPTPACSRLTANDSACTENFISSGCKRCRMPANSPDDNARSNDVPLLFFRNAVVAPDGSARNCTSKSPALESPRTEGASFAATSPGAGAGNATALNVNAAATTSTDPGPPWPSVPIQRLRCGAAAANGDCEEPCTGGLLLAPPAPPMVVISSCSAVRRLVVRNGAMQRHTAKREDG